MQMRREYERRTPDLPRESFGELLGELANNSAALVRDEIELARQEMTEKVGMLRTGITISAIGLVISLVAVLTLTAAAVIGLAHFVGAGISALIIGAALAFIGVITACVGNAQIRRTSLKPAQTIETLEEDRKWLKELT
jgi:uncharacterized membrane protein YqjE